MLSRKFAVVVILSTGICLSAILCTTPPKEEAVTDAYGGVFAGSAACAGCHRDLDTGFVHTPHYLDSRPANAQTIHGSFESGRDSVIYHPSLAVIMQRKDNGFIQAAYRDGKLVRSEPFDLVIGAGRKGQSYLYWRDQLLFQLPVSYFTPLDAWCESPGYTADTPYYDRPVPASCLECHTTHAQTVFRSSRDYGDRYDSSRLIYGITCEKCHGPGAQHIAFHTRHPEEKQGKYILNAGRMARQQRLDACALCHSGSRVPLKPAFSFRVGDRLDTFSGPKFDPANAATLDVHGNQYGLLTSSKCFAATQMDCSTCHTVHANSTGGLKAYSQRCISCHGGVRHTSAVSADNCIDCHMPALPSQKIVMHLSGQSDTGRVVSNFVRTHRIAIYRP